MRSRFVRAVLVFVLVGLPSCVSSVIEDWRADEVHVMGVREVSDRQVSVVVALKNVRRTDDGVYAFTIPLREPVTHSPPLEWLGPRPAKSSRIYTPMWKPEPYGISSDAFRWPSVAARSAFRSATPTAGVETVTASDPYFVGLPRRRHLGLRVERAEDGTLVATVLPLARSRCGGVDLRRLGRDRPRSAIAVACANGSLADGRSRWWRTSCCSPRICSTTTSPHHRLISKDTAML
jgi:hypothetical protein